VSILGKLALAILGLALLLPGLCFGVFGLSVIPAAFQDYDADVSQALLPVLLWMVIAALLVWAAIAVFRQIGK
jgi:hypothetical protein